FWSYAINGTKRMESVVAEPIRAFLQGELRNFKVCSYFPILPFPKIILTLVSLFRTRGDTWNNRKRLSMPFCLDMPASQSQRSLLRSERTHFKFTKLEKHTLRHQWTFAC